MAVHQPSCVGTGNSMQIKPVSPEAIETALQMFDSKWRDSKEYVGWENNKNYLHAISHGVGSTRRKK
jgi:hypothetical protein